MNRLAWLTLVLACSLVAGCMGGSSKDGPAKSEAPTSAPPATVTSETGGIEGRVLNEELLPIPGAEVAILKREASVKSDDEGRFSFSDLPPGSHDVVVQKLGYEAASRRVEVVAGEVASMNVTLTAIAIVEAYVEPLIMDGHILVSNALLGAVEGDTGVVGGCTKCHFNWNASADVVAMVLEVAYKPTLSVPPNMLLYTQVYAATRASGTPVVNEEWASGHKESIEVKKASPYYQYLGCGLFSFCYDQRFTEYVTLFHGAPPKDDFSAIPPG